MTTTDIAQTEQAVSPEVALAPAADAAPNADIASDSELTNLQDNISAMNAAAVRLEHEIERMIAETGGAVEGSTEIQHARQQAREMRSIASNASAAITNAPTDPRTGKKMISAKKVAALSNGVVNCILGAETEGAKIEKVAAEESSHEIAVHAKAGAAAKSATSKVVRVFKSCTHGVACMVGARSPAKHSWFGDAAAGVGEELDDLGANVASGWKRGWNHVVGLTSGVGAYVSSTLGAITSYDYVGTAERAVDTTITGVKHMIGAGMDAVRQAKDTVAHHVVQWGSAAKSTITGTVSSVLQTGRSVAGHVYDAVGSTISSGLGWAAGGLSYLNPIGSAHAETKAPHSTPAHHKATAHKAVPHATEHAPAAHAETTLTTLAHKAAEEVKALHLSLPSISLPSWSEVMHTAIPLVQRVTHNLAHAS